MNFSKKNHELKKGNRNVVSKTTLTLLITLLLTLCSMAQNGINYKAVVKDGTGSIMESAPVSIQFIVYEGSALTNNVYQESHTVNTDANGIVIVNIGEGTTGDVFSTLDWENDEHFLNVQVNVGAGLVDLGTTQFKTVPYALVAKDVENTIWNESNTGDISFSAGEVGIGITNPQHPFSVLQSTGFNNTVRIQSLDHPAGKDLVELVIPSGSPAGSQFLEMQNGTSIVAQVNGDGSAKFKSVQFEDNSVQTTAALGPIAYGFITSAGSTASGSGNYGSAWVSANNRYEITITGESYFWQSYSTIVTGSTSSIYRIRVSSVNGKLIIYLYSSTGSLIQGNFQFITYK